MAQFRYQGRNSQGQLVSGELNAPNLDTAAGQLVNLGVTPVAVNEIPGSDAKSNSILSFLRNKVSVPDMIMFCRQMYAICRAGIPIIRGIRGLTASTRQPYLRQTLEDVVENLESGMDLATSLNQHAEVFNTLFISIIRVGENSGRLDEAFLQLSEYIERDFETRKKIKAALRYPTFVIAALALAVAVVNVQVIPAFARLFEKFGADLPLPTKLIIGMSDLFVNYWPYMLAITVAALFSWRQYLKTEPGQLFWGERKLRLPIVGDIIERASMARYSRSFAMMLKSGVPLPTALALCARVIDNQFLAEKIKNIRSGVERGESLLATHTSSGMFTPLVLQMIAVGEESGQVDDLLSEVAGFYEREVNYDVESLSAKIEPLLIVVMAAFVLILALGIFLPLWDMYEVQK